MKASACSWSKQKELLQDRNCHADRAAAWPRRSQRVGNLLQVATNQTCSLHAGDGFGRICGGSLRFWILICCTLHVQNLRLSVCGFRGVQVCPSTMNEWHAAKLPGDGLIHLEYYYLNVSAPKKAAHLSFCTTGYRLPRPQQLPRGLHGLCKSFKVNRVCQPTHFECQCLPCRINVLCNVHMEEDKTGVAGPRSSVITCRGIARLMLDGQDCSRWSFFWTLMAGFM